MTHYLQKLVSVLSDSQIWELLCEYGPSPIQHNDEEEGGPLCTSQSSPPTAILAFVSQASFLLSLKSVLLGWQKIAKGFSYHSSTDGRTMFSLLYFTSLSEILSNYLNQQWSSFLYHRTCDGSLWWEVFQSPVYVVSERSEFITAGCFPVKLFFLCSSPFKASHTEQLPGWDSRTVSVEPQLISLLLFFKWSKSVANVLDIISNKRIIRK